jgi:hypothetical protein
MYLTTHLNLQCYSCIHKNHVEKKYFTIQHDTSKELYLCSLVSKTQDDHQSARRKLCEIINNMNMSHER